MRSQSKPAVQSVHNLTDRALITREKLKIATREALNEVGFRRMRVQDVTERAGVAAGLVYRYFSGLRVIVYEVSKDFMDELNTRTKKLPVYTHPYDQIVERLTLAVEMFSDNPGIVRCLFQLDGDFPEFGKVWKDAAHEWNLHVAGFLRTNASIPPHQAEHMAFVLGAMTEGVFFQYLIRHTEDLSDMATEPRDIAEMIAIMWYRSIFLETPPTDKLRTGNALISGLE